MCVRGIMGSKPCEQKKSLQFVQCSKRGYLINRVVYECSSTAYGKFELVVIGVITGLGPWREKKNPVSLGPSFANKTIMLQLSEVARIVALLEC